MFEAAAVDQERAAGREPMPKPLSKATVRNDGTLKFKVKKKGQYTLAANVGSKDEPSWRYMSVPVRD